MILMSDACKILVTSAHVLLVYVLSSSTTVNDIQEDDTFVSKHESDREDPPLTPTLAIDTGVLQPQTMDKEQSEQSNLFGHGGRSDDSRAKLDEIWGGDRIVRQRVQGGGVVDVRRCMVQDGDGLKPEETHHLTSTRSQDKDTVAVNSPTLKSRELKSSGGEEGRAIGPEDEVELLMDRRLAWTYEL
jgi:hypothetical protein